MADETYTLVAINTGHVTEETMKRLNEDHGFLTAVYPEGALVSCLLSEASPIPDLEAVRVWARERGYGYVLLDCDASDVDGLPLYDW